MAEIAERMRTSPPSLKAAPPANATTTLATMTRAKTPVAVEGMGEAVVGMAAAALLLPPPAGLLRLPHTAHVYFAVAIRRHRSESDAEQARIGVAGSAIGRPAWRFSALRHPARIIQGFPRTCVKNTVTGTPRRRIICTWMSSSVWRNGTAYRRASSWEPNR